MSGIYKTHGQKVLEKEGALGEVWISGEDFASDFKELKKNNITAICTVGDSEI